MTNKFNDTYLQQLDKRLSELRREVESDLLRYQEKGWLSRDKLGIKIEWEKK